MQRVLNLLMLFKFDHLPEKLQKISKPFSDLANETVRRIPHGTKDDDLIVTETEACLRKLLEAKDCVVRAALR